MSVQSPIARTLIAAAAALLMSTVAVAAAVSPVDTGISLIQTSVYA